MGKTKAAKKTDEDLIPKYSSREQAKLNKLEAKILMYEGKLTQNAMRVETNSDFCNLQKCQKDLAKIHAAGMKKAEEAS
jgi:hypothetical protein